MDELKLDVLIVEDNLSFALELEMLIQEIGYNIVGRVDNSDEALEIILNKQPDFILMDVDIKGNMTGIEIGDKIKHLDIPILFITSFGDDVHYQKAKQTLMVGYLVKPIDKFTLLTSIQLAIAQIQKKNVLDIYTTEGEDEDFIFNDFIFFKKKGIYHKVSIDNIMFIKSDNNYCEAYVNKSLKFMTRTPLSKIEALSPPTRFMRVHRKYIVQLNKIEKIDFQSSKIMVTGYEFPISRSKRKELEEVIKRIGIM